MTILFPDPYPGELLFSVLTRYRSRMGITNRQMMQEVFQGHLFTVSRRLPVQLSLLVEGLPSWQQYSPEDLAKHHSLLRYYTAFQSHDQAASTLKRMYGAGGGLPAHMGLTMSEISEKTQLLLCPDCVTANTVKYGEPYWHAVHQAPGVWYCPHHPETLLLSTSAEASSRATGSSMATPLEIVIETNPSITSAKLINQAKHILQYISRSSLFLLSADHHVIDDSWASKKYKEKLAELGCLFLRGDVNRSKLKTLISEIFPEDILKLLGYKNPERFKNLLNSLALPRVKNAHTLHHLVFMYILGVDLERFFVDTPRKIDFIHQFGSGPWPCKNPMSDLNCSGLVEKFEYNTRLQFSFKCPECGFTYLKTHLDDEKRIRVYDYGEKWYAKLQHLMEYTELPKRQVAMLMGVNDSTITKLANNLENNMWVNCPSTQRIVDRFERKMARRQELRVTHRQKIVEEMRKNPNILRSDTFDEGFRKASHWLRRYDAEWFERNGPIRRTCRKLPVMTDGDWLIIDKATATKIYELAKYLISEDEETNQIRRISKKTFIQYIKAHYTDFYSGYMPLTRQAIDASAESTYIFQIRRLEYIARNLAQEKKYVSFIGFLNLGKVFDKHRSDQMITQAKKIHSTYIDRITVSN